MSRRTGITWDGGAKKLHNALKRGANPGQLRAAVKRATQQNLKLAEREMRRVIRSCNFAANADLTVAIKRSSKPLVDRGELFQAVTSRLLTSTSGFVGIKRTDGKYNVAVALHNGRTIRVTAKMRGLFRVLWLASKGGIIALTGAAAELFRRKPKGWYPLSPRTKHIRLPARPFATMTFKSRDLKKRVKANWERAIQEFLKQAAR